MSEQAVDAGGGAAAPRDRRPSAGAPGAGGTPFEDAATGAARHGAPAAGPAAARGFVGRERELRELRADIVRAGLDTLSGRKAVRSRVLLIAGRPGSGRTALAEELARRLAGDYPDGLLRARLTEPGGAPVPTEHVARGLLRALGVPAPPGAAEDELTEALRTALAGRRALLLLDDAQDAAQVDPLLPAAPRCLVVAVSRGPLTGIPNVRPCALGGLDRDAAVRLLADRAGSGPPAGATRVAVDPRAAEALVEECGGLPAALVLVGGWLAARPMVSVADVLRRLRDLPPEHDPAGEPARERDRDGTGPYTPGAGRDDGGHRAPDRPAPDRDAGHRPPGRERPVPDREAPDREAAEDPLARVLRFVHMSLPRPAARTLRLLALAPGGLVDAHTASALAGCSVPAAESALRGLAAAGALRPAGPDGAVWPSYRVPGCLAPRLHALLLERERPAEVELARARMLERNVRLLRSCRAAAEPAACPGPAPGERAGEAGPPRFPSREAAAGWLEHRLPVLLGAARDAVAEGGLDTLARRLVAALSRALTAHRGEEGAAPELYPLHRLVLRVAERRGLKPEQAAALLNLADLDEAAGRTSTALARYRDALEAARAAGDPQLTARALESLGGTYHASGDWHRAADWYGRALALRLARGEPAEEARLYGRLGAVHTYAGRWGEALRHWRAAAAGYRRLGDLRGHARALAETARVQEYAGRPEEALRTCETALERARRAGDERLQAALRLRMADTLDRLGDPAAARLHRSAARTVLGDTPGFT